MAQNLGFDRRSWITSIVETLKKEKKKTMEDAHENILEADPHQSRKDYSLSPKHLSFTAGTLGAEAPDFSRSLVSLNVSELLELICVLNSL